MTDIPQDFNAEKQRLIEIRLAQGLDADGNPLQNQQMNSSVSGKIADSRIPSRRNAPPPQSGLANNHTNGEHQLNAIGSNKTYSNDYRNQYQRQWGRLVNRISGWLVNSWVDN